MYKRKREELGYSLRTLSTKCDLSHSYIDKLKKRIDQRSNKANTPTLHVLYKLSQALNNPLYELIEASGYSITEMNRGEYLSESKSEYLSTIRIEQYVNFLILQLENKNENLELYSKVLNEPLRMLLLNSLENLLKLARKINV